MLSAIQSSVAELNPVLPWERATSAAEILSQNNRSYYEVYFGSIKLKEANNRLLASFPDSKPEQATPKPFAPLGSIILDDSGRLTSKKSIAISSYGWALPKALKDNFKELASWPAVESSLCDELFDQLQCLDDNGNPEPINSNKLNSAWQWFINKIEIDLNLVMAPTFSIYSQCSGKNADLPEPSILNSFFIEDLSFALKLLSSRTAPLLVKRYLGKEKPPVRTNILEDLTSLESAIAPEMHPLARWPGPWRNPLVTMQQAAVNLACNLKEGEMLAVNGPPGTGKTTLLRDVVASIVSSRAEAMAKFDDPESAFIKSTASVAIGNYSTTPYLLDKTLQGFEMLVASSNNKAVENVSKELPGINSIAADATNLRYFSPIAAKLNSSIENWGLIAAALGNAKNQSAFRNSFWFDSDYGLLTYLKSICGDTDSDKNSGNIPRIIKELNPPINHREALRRWQVARMNFTKVLSYSRKIRDERENLRLRCLHYPIYAKTFFDGANHSKDRPSFFYRLLRLKRYRLWREENNKLWKNFVDTHNDTYNAGVLPDGFNDILEKSLWFGIRSRIKRQKIQTEISSLLETLKLERDALSSKHVIDWDYFDSDKNSAHTVSPWFNSDEQRLRDDVFIASIDLHRAFIDAAAKPLRINIGLSLDLLAGKGLKSSTTNVEDLHPDIVSSLFIVIPCISTTFASVRKMLAVLPPSSLGWLLVDEAGQAAPQMVVGALLRAKRAIIVGDPIQIPPVVTLSDKLVLELSRYLSVNSARFMAPVASVQTLADAANKSYAKFASITGDRYVGVPLLVHRRCSEPMFSISNRVAYEEQMLLEKSVKASKTADLLGPSRWIQVAGNAVDKWCNEEGLVALEMVEKLAVINMLDLYIVTPFVQVAEGLRKLFQSSSILQDKIPDITQWVRDRIGTIHTVQGREAEAVIFVLGAPLPEQSGARDWAGKEPNLINVAVTRAKDVFYVIGNRDVWRNAGVFADLFTLLARHENVESEKWSK